MFQQVTKVRVFVASPSDVQRERDSLPAVIEELNTTLGQALGIVVELVRWETHCYPAMGRPQQVINEQIGAYDIFVGILWKRFGTPTGVADSGTEEEFNLAYGEWSRDNKLRITFYFCTDGVYPKSQDEIGQLGKVIAFKVELRNKALSWDYPSADTFPDKIRPHLSRILLEMFPRRPTYESAGGILDRPSPPGESTNELAQRGVDLTELGTPKQHAGEQQIAETVGVLEGSVGHEGFATNYRFQGDLSDFQLVRLQLLTSTWLDVSALTRKCRNMNSAGLGKLR